MRPSLPATPLHLTPLHLTLLAGPMGKKKKGPDSPASPRLESEDMPDVYNDASETPEEVVSEAGNEDAAAKAAAEESAAATKAAAEEATWAAEAKARAEAKVQAAAAAEAVAKAEAKAAADAAKVALAKAEAEAAAAAQLASEQAAVKAKEAAGAKAQVIMAPAAVAEMPLAMAGADLEAGDDGDGEKFVTVVTETAADAGGRLSQLSIDDARAGLWLLSQRHVETSKSKLVSFKSYGSSLAQTACAPAPEGSSVGGALWKDVKWRQMAELPLGAVYGLMALLFVALFAVVRAGQEGSGSVVRVSG